MRNPKTPGCPSHVYLAAFGPAPSCPRKRVLAMMLPPLTSVLGSHIPNVVFPFASDATGYRLYTHSSVEIWPSVRHALALVSAGFGSLLSGQRLAAHG